MRLVNEHSFSPRELREEWTLYDILNAHEALDYKLHIQQIASSISSQSRR